ncbi:MAG: DUF177 domain-containing protein [Aquamicrobium sp.]|uniref:YceD family protein n=1 Tax=Aquamicrobium sp. TaxID=1872579 RepID=UPI00349E54C7|nr:DUF177 domain-containing protein [Aquamicrobium sp.]
MVHSAPSSASDPWRHSVNVAQIPETGLRVEFEATADERAALAATAGLREVSRATAAFELTHAGGGKVAVAGRVTARVGQTCVVTLDPVENTIDEAVDLVFAPEAEIPRLAAMIDDDADSDEIPDPPEPIAGGLIDLGRVATDALFLGIDPYPRRPDAVFESPAPAVDPEEHPFAALKALQQKGKPPA